MHFRGRQTRSYRLNDDSSERLLDADQSPRIGHGGLFSNACSRAERNPRKQGSGEHNSHGITAWKHVLPTAISDPVEPVTKML